MLADPASPGDRTCVYDGPDGRIEVGVVKQTCEPPAGLAPEAIDPQSYHPRIPEPSEGKVRVTPLGIRTRYVFDSAFGTNAWYAHLDLGITGLKEDVELVARRLHAESRRSSPAIIRLALLDGPELEPAPPFRERATTVLTHSAPIIRILRHDSSGVVAVVVAIDVPLLEKPSGGGSHVVTIDATRIASLVPRTPHHHRVEIELTAETVVLALRHAVLADPEAATDRAPIVILEDDGDAEALERNLPARGTTQTDDTDIDASND